MTEYILGKVNTTFSLWRVETDTETKTKTFTREKVVSRSEAKAKEIHPDLSIDDTLQGTLLVRTYTDLSDLSNYEETKGKKSTAKKEVAPKEVTSEVKAEPKKRGRKPKAKVEDSQDIESDDIDSDSDLDIDVEFVDKTNRQSGRYSDVISALDDNSEFEYNEPKFIDSELGNINIDEILNDDIFSVDDDLF